MSRCGITLALAVLLFTTSSHSHAATPKQINDAIDRAKEYLYAQQQSDGTWELVPVAEEVPPSAKLGIKQSAKAGQWGGRTAIVVDALLSAGENPQDEHLTKAIEFLKHAKIEGVYALGLRCQVWLLLPQTPEVKQHMAADARTLVGMMKHEGKAKGMYDYVNTPKSQEYSHSRSQYAVLGVWAAMQAGVEIPTSYWNATEEAWEHNQEADGGWTYNFGSKYPTSPGMTAAAVATLYEAQDALAGTRGLSCTGNVESESIKKGLLCLAANSDKIATTKHYPRDFPYATLYAFERVAVAGGQKYIGDVDWFQRGADWLIKTQQKDGAWPAKPADGASAGKWLAGVPDVSFALLFLARGRAPLFMSKLEYRLTPETGAATEAHWNQRPRDIANAAKAIGQLSERHLNWQVVSLKANAKSQDDVNDSAILYIAGNQNLSFTPDERAILKRFVEQGGLILGTADCGDKAFDVSFRKLAASLFPTYEFRKLPADHTIFHGELFDGSKWKTPSDLVGVSNGVRELMLLAPESDLGKQWTLPGPPKSDAVQLAANLYFYATGKRGMQRGQTYLVKPDPKIKPTTIVTLARLQYGGIWNPEPGGWRRIAAILHNQRKIKLQVETVKLGEGKLNEYKLAHLTGTTALKLDGKARAELAEFVSGGGTLIVDAAGGATAFATDAEKLLSGLGAGALRPIPAKHALFTAGGTAPPAIRYRDLTRRVVGNLNTSRLQIIEVNGVAKVIYSPDDLSAGLVGENVDGVSGYDPATATQLMTRIILYASGATAPGANDAKPPAQDNGDGL
jgi:hypothetical protein